jgi:tetratricopeptide (TPR) repeat protein/2-keto-3-deoxy-L-rhamnonate aldolase RhmA
MLRFIIVVAITVGTVVDARQTGAQPVQYRSPAGVEYRSLPDTDAVKTARAAHQADPKNIAKIIELGVAQSGARQFREAIATFTRGLEIEPDNALLLRWRGHRYLSVREFDRAFADLSRGAKIDPTIYGNWYHLGIVQFLRGDFADAAASFAKALPIAPDPAELAGSTDWLWMSLSRAGRGAEAKAMLDRRLDTKPDFKPVTNAYTRRLQLYRGEIGPDAVVTSADTDEVQIATLAYGLGNWYLVRGDKAQARRWFERSVQASGGWPGFGFIVSEVELGRLAQSPERINPMIALHERGLPVFGVTHPAIVAGRGAANAALPSLTEAAQQTVAYRFSDFAYNNYSTETAARFREYMSAILAAGGSAREHAFISKVPIIHADPTLATRRIVEQLNAGHVGVMLQQVEGPGEVKTALAAMRFASKGGTRPDHGAGLAAAYWKLTEAEYRQMADPWPLNPRGELVLWAIVESKKGIANIREIAQVPGLTVIVVGAGTLGGVFSSTGADGQRVRDQAGFDAGVSAILSACKEFKVACSHPANNPKEIQDLMARGFTVFTMQRRDAAAFDAIALGRKLSGRD